MPYFTLLKTLKKPCDNRVIGTIMYIRVIISDKNLGIAGNLLPNEHTHQQK